LDCKQGLELEVNGIQINVEKTNVENIDSYVNVHDDAFDDIFVALLIVRRMKLMACSLLIHCWILLLFLHGLRNIL
jgi:hypothetical protein